MTKTSLIVSILAVIFLSCSTDKVKTDVFPKDILLKQLRSTHTEKDWFVPVMVALDGVTAEQAMWRDSSGNHSIGQLTHHLAFWNERQLKKFAGEHVGEYEGSNDETFTKFDQALWSQTVSKLDSVLTAMEKLIERADDAKIKEWAPSIANINTHNAYHIGQIVYVRKQQKSWDPEKGVK
jgi:hypothetical protein